MIRVGLGAGALVIVAGIAWLIVTALLVRKEVTALKQELPQLRSQIADGQLDQAKVTAADLAAHAHRAHALTSGPAWYLAGELPWLGPPVGSVRTIAAQSDLLGRDVLPGVLQLGAKLTSSSLRNGDQINLAPLVEAGPVIEKASAAADRATAEVSALPRHTAISSVDSARVTVETDLVQIRNQLQAASRAAQILPPMLGQSGTKRYFIGFLNESESRGLGGLPGAFAIMTADDGKLSFTHFESDSALDGVSAKVDLGQDYKATYGRNDPTSFYINSDVSPSFPDAAKIWASMWEQKSGEHVDGAVALDPTALSYLLGVTGPATASDGQQVNAGNVTALTQQGAYAQFTDPLARKAYLLSIAQAAGQQVLRGGNTTELAKAGGKAAQQRRLVVWSSDTSVESVLVASDFAGTLPTTTAPVSGFVTTNAAGTKLDYYLDRTMSYERSSCTATTATASFTMKNDAPASGLPAYVTTRLDSQAAGSTPGDNRLLVRYFASAGSSVVSVTLDGKPVSYVPNVEGGLTVTTIDVELPVGSTQTLVVKVAEPASSKPVQLLKQPLVRPLTVAVSQPSC